ncbi:MAG: tetratricopeptide repeat-containing sensor histidine kinase, partial [Chitinophagales bacterium]
CEILLKTQPKDFLEPCQSLIAEAVENKFSLIEAKAKLLLASYYLNFQGFQQVIDLLIPLVAFSEKHHPLLIYAETAFKLAAAYIFSDNYRHNPLSLLHKAVAIYEQTKNHSQETGRIYFRIAGVHDTRGEFDLAIENFEKAIHAFKDAPYHNESLYVYCNLGTAYAKKGNLTKGLKYVHKSLELAIEHEETNLIGFASQRLSGFYIYLHRFDKAHEYIDKAIKITRKIKMGIESTLQDKGVIFKAQKKYVEALQCWEESLKIVPQTSLSRGLSYLNMGDVYNFQGKLEDSLEALQKALHLFEQNQLTAPIALCYSALGNLYNKMKNYPKAIDYLQKATPFLKNAPKEYEVILKSLATAYEGMGDLTTAYRYIKEYVEVHEELFDIKGKEMLELQHEYNLSLKEKEMEILQLKNSELEEMNELKSRFFTHISHELRTPLTLILGPVQSLLEEKQNFQNQHISYLKTIRRNGKNMLQLIDEVLTLSKLNTQKLPLEEENLSLHPFIHRVFHTFQSAADFKNIRYQLSMWINRQLTVQIDRGKLEKILNNLLSNALKYTPEKGEILVLAEELKDSKHLQIKVKDE